MSLTISRHGAHIRPIHDTLVLLSQSLDVALAEVQDLLLQHSAVLVAGSLLNGEVQQHHSPDEPKTDQKEPQLLGGQLPQEGGCHAGWRVGLLRLLNDDLTKERGTGSWGIRRAVGAWPWWCNCGCCEVVEGLFASPV